MDQEYAEKTIKRISTKTKDKPQCERCGRPVKISSEDYMRDEVLCINCASDTRVPNADDEVSSGWPD